jgi:AraC family transcriptional regulator, ethanolamine operon transcriptional activator
MSLPPLPNFSIAAFADASEQERGLVGWNQRYTQLGTTRFEGSVARLDFGRVSVTEERLNVTVAQSTAPPAGKVVLVLPAHRPNGRINGTTRTEPGFLHLGGHEISVVTTPQTQGYYVTLDDKDLPGLDRRRTGPLCSIEGYPDAQGLSAWIASILAAAPDGMRRSPRELGEVLPGYIIDRVADICAHVSSRDRKQLAESYAHAVFRKARRHLDQIPQSELSVAALAKAVDLPEHVLRSAFTQAVGVSPRIWLRQWRLDQAHRAMLSPDSARKGVAHIAMEHGFYHLGRFAAYYAQTFHELPVETIRSVIG